MKNEKTAVCHNDGSNNFNGQPKYNQSNEKIQRVTTFGGQPTNVSVTFGGLRLVCDECASPLHLYGANFFDTYTNGTANILRCLCDICAAEFWGGVK